jgi:predicted nucleic acid-binding protein
MKTNLFLDTSAIVKRYVNETGSEWVVVQCKQAADNTIILSYATLAEAVTAFCRKARLQDLNQRISESDRDHHIRIFRQDVEQQYTLVDVTKAVYTHAGDLCRIHKLRAYDAIQLACALKASGEFIALEKAAPIFVSADTDLLSIAEAEGLNIEDPNAH